MPKVKISEFSSTPANNTDIDSINISEGCAPSGINDAIRELMAQLKDFQTGAVGDSFNGPVGTTTAAAGAFTTLSSTGNTTLGDASGDSVTINGTATFANANPVLSAGTANGVAYLNGSKVVTSGSALTFDGTNLKNIGPSNASLGAYSANGGSSQFVLGNSAGTSHWSFYETIGASGQQGSFNLYDNVAASLRLTVDTSGNLGIGTSSPLAKIHANNSSSGATALTAIFGNGASAALNNGSAIFLNNSSSFNASAYSARIASVITNASTQASDLIFGLYNGSSGSDLMRLDFSGNLGLGVTPSAWNSGYKALEVKSSGGLAADGAADVLLLQNLYLNSSGQWIRRNAQAGGFYNISGAAHVWYQTGSSTAGSVATLTQALTLNASGNLFLGTTTTPTGTGSGRFNVEPSNQNGIAIGVVTTGNTGLDINVNSTGSYFDYYRYNNANVGSITTNGTTTSYNVTSDQRLKENIVDAPEFGSVIDSIKVRSYDWKADNSHQRYGFIAQELVTVAPEAVHQPEDSEQMMAVDYSKLVPMLVKEIQSLRQRVATLEAK